MNEPRVDAGSTPVPIIDIAGDPNAIGRQLDEVCHEIGFFQIIGHGVDPSVADAAWQVSRTFFDLPLAERLTAAPPYAGYAYGYYGFEAEALAASLGAASDPDPKETFSAGPFEHRPAVPGEEELLVANLFPDAALPEMRAVWHAYYDAMAALGARVMGLFARGLSLPADFFDRYLDRHLSALRAINYPAGERSDRVRAGAHTDYGTLTILRQDDVGGLEVQCLDGRWAPVTPVPGAYVINIGDLMARWTNDRWRSTMHRVVDPPADARGAQRTTEGRAWSARRQSMPFFHNANWDADIVALPTCVPPGEAPRYPRVLAGPHLAEKFGRSVTS